MLLFASLALAGPTATCQSGGQPLVELEYVSATEARAKAARPGGSDLGAHIIARWARTTIGAADGRFMSLMLSRAGKTLESFPGEADVAQVPGSDRLWTNLRFFLVPSSITAPFEVRFVDAVAAKACVFRIDPSDPNDPLATYDVAFELVRVE